MNLLKRIFIKIKRFFQHTNIRVSTKVEAPIVNKDKKIFTLVAIVPHTKKRQGADDYNGESEWVKGDRHIGMVKSKLLKASEYLNDVEVVVHKLYRDPNRGYSSQCRKIAREARKLKADLVMSFHFNAGGGVGFEALVAKDYTSPNDLEYIVGRSLADNMKNLYAFTLRHDKGMKKITSKHNGSGMALSVERSGMPFLLLEPAFLDSIHAQSKLIVEKEYLYVDEIVKAIIVGIKHWKA